MKHKKQILAGVLSIVLLCCACSAGGGAGHTTDSLSGGGLSTTPDPAQPLAMETNALPFTDVPGDAVYAQAVAYCLEHHIMSGNSTTEATFGPDVITTRAMTAAILYRMEGEPAVSGEDGFTDTTPGLWYSDAVLWASDQGLMVGHGNGLFGTNDPVTREQLITILHRYLGAPAGQGGFSDLNQASGYAQNAVQWAAGAGICQDFASNAFRPAEPIHRWELACVLHRTLTLDAPGSGAAAVDSITTNGGETIALTKVFSRISDFESHFISDDPVLNVRYILS